MIKFFLVFFLLTSCGKPVAIERERTFRSALYQGVSEELILGTTMSLDFDLLPLKGEVDKKGKLWTGDSWPLKRGSINYRWNAPKDRSIYNSPIRRQVETLPVPYMKLLSPAEKYDLYMGRYDYPLWYEVSNNIMMASMSWEGLCHGWSGASLNHPEPKSKTVMNPDGIEIYFGSSDIKALLSYAYSRILISNHDLLGQRCDSDNPEDEKCNNDLTPMSFHLVLANRLGLRGRSFIVDIDRGREVWNHPVVSFESTLLSLVGTSNGKRAVISTKLSYVDVTEKNSWEQQGPRYGLMFVKYELDMEKSGKIVGGKWLSKDRPDFLWIVNEATSFDGYLKSVMRLLK